MSNTRYHKSFFIDSVREEEVEKELVAINPSKSTGYDAFSPKVRMHFIKQTLTRIFNKSFSTGIFPDSLKF